MIWFDLSICSFQTPPTDGIGKVELNLAHALVNQGNPDIGFCLFDVETKRFCLLDRQLVSEIWQRHQTNDQNITDLSVGVGGEENDIFQDGDSLVMTGVHLNKPIVSRVSDIKKNIALRFLGVCHDMIPMHYPHWIPGLFERYQHFLHELTKTADHVICNSEHTRRDYEAWLDEQQLTADTARRPQTSVMRLGLGLQLTSAQEAEKVQDKVKDLLQEPYVLCVSTVIARKGHEVLARAYARLRERGVAKLPKLVFVGAVGYGGKEILAKIHEDHQLNGLVETFHQLSDHDLRLLYQNCLFTVYPSFYEGWGIPVAESLGFGKFCIAGTGSSLPEVGEQFAEHIDPGDIEAWANALFFYSHCPEGLAKKTQSIVKNYQPPTWEYTAKQVLQCAQLQNTR